jgi:hypothetical protein
MTILTFFLVACVLMGLAVLLWDRTKLGEPARLDQYECFLDRGWRFEHLSRIAAPDDFEFLKGFPGSGRLVSRLRRERRRVLRQVLRDLRQEFRALVAVGIMLASLPTARQSSFGVKLMLRAAVFNARYYWLYLGTFWPFLRFAGAHTGWLTDRLADTREVTRALLASLSASDMDALRDQILDH